MTQRSEEPAHPWRGLAAATWRRELAHLRAEPTRWLGMVAQPLLIWALFAAGMSDVFVAPDGAASYASWFYPGVLVMVILFSGIFATISVIDDRNAGFLQPVMIAPGGASAYVFGKIAGVATLGLTEVAILLVLLPWVAPTSSGIAWLPLAILLVATAVALAATNLAVAVRVGSSRSFHAIMSVVLIPAWVLSGAMFPARDHALAWLMQANPLTYAVDGIRASVGIGASPDHSVLYGVGAMVALTVVAAGLAIRRLRTISTR